MIFNQRQSMNIVHATYLFQRKTIAQMHTQTHIHKNKHQIQSGKWQVDESKRKEKKIHLYSAVNAQLMFSTNQNPRERQNEWMNDDFNNSLKILTTKYAYNIHVCIVYVVIYKKTSSQTRENLIKYSLSTEM